MGDATNPDAAREARARARATWPGRRIDLAAEGTGEVADLERRGISGEERLAMIWRITLDAWTLAGRELPTYDRASMPGRLIRLEDDD